ncbi:glycine betaine/proline transport system substrate-binding protein [Micromonospora pattaloongensis]|uniref:Glycine betaine/proline transport system substrate-binding protein n=1 Tax=Micromonospora pattaloongensis TaxID=405436 RepID=A0A1H3NSF2_9ACTN|nr:ABC transporter substrate-binding protein [Micromonospora pattaloongensis]SDY91355.1 glycine betaine/proline transport system substrate-binding protein [Micromonospora pattaloongensis]
MRRTITRTVRLTGVSITTAAALALAGCGGAKVGADDDAAARSVDCGTVNLAVNPWVGYEANAAVIAYVAETELGCKVTKKDLKEEISWQGFGTGEVDAIVENWGHEDLKKKYIDEQKTAVAAGSTGVQGVIGWYVPPWMAQKYPDITDWKNLNKYASLFKTSESGGKGQLLDGDPSFVTNDEALVKNLKLNYKVVYAGSEPALIQAFRQAEAKKTPLMGYFYDPQWFLSELQLVKVNLPPYTQGCDADAEKVACDYPKYDLDKVVSKKFADANGPAYQLIKNFTWTNADQNVVAKYIAEDKMSPQDAAKKWVEANRDKVKAWLPKS